MAVDTWHLHHLDDLPDVLADQQQVFAFFDLDKTLILGYSVLALVWECVRQGQPGIRRVGRELISAIDQRSLGGHQYSQLYKSVLRCLEGMPEQDLTLLAEKAFDRSLAASIFREDREIVHRHQQLGHKVVIVSSATSYQVAPIARALNIDEVRCTRLKTDKGILTGEVKGALCIGEGKITEARKMVRKAGTSLDHAWFYSDSEDDLPLLSKVGNPVATNPSAALEEDALERGWKILKFCSRGKPSFESLVRTALTASTLVSTAAVGAAIWTLSRSPVRAGNSMVNWLADMGSAFAGLDIEIEGEEHLANVRPAIFVFNHQSYLDSIVIAHLLRHDFVAFCKKEVADNPILGPLLKAHGTIFVDRARAGQTDCLHQARTALRSGKSLVIAPEGTRSATGELLEFKHGAFYLARKMQVPIVPLVLHNVADALPKGSLLLRPATAQVTVLPPLRPDTMGNSRIAARRLMLDYERVMKQAGATAFEQRLSIA